MRNFGWKVYITVLVDSVKPTCAVITLMSKVSTCRMYVHYWLHAIAINT